MALLQTLLMMSATIFCVYGAAMPQAPVVPTPAPPAPTPAPQMMRLDTPCELRNGITGELIQDATANICPNRTECGVTKLIIRSQGSNSSESAANWVPAVPAGDAYVVSYCTGAPASISSCLENIEEKLNECDSDLACQREGNSTNAACIDWNFRMETTDPGLKGTPLFHTGHDLAGTLRYCGVRDPLMPTQGFFGQYEATLPLTSDACLPPPVGAGGAGGAEEAAEA